MTLEDEVALRFSTVRDIDKTSSSHHIASKEMVQEQITLRGINRTVNRYYVTYSNGFRGVGWIIDEDINECIICNNEFGLFLRKHHCRSCGNIICHCCSDNFVIIEEMKEIGEQRVCNMCYWGQVCVARTIFSSLPHMIQSLVYATNTRPKEDEDEDSLEEEDFIIASKINASINASVRSYHCVVSKSPEFSGEIILEQGCDWKMILRSLVRDLNIYQDLETALTAKVKNLQRPEIGEEGAAIDSGSLSESEINPQLLKSRIKELIQQIGIR
jgi:hypothetical protein